MVDVEILPNIENIKKAKVPVAGRYSAAELMKIAYDAYSFKGGKIIALISADITSPKVVNGKLHPYWGVFGLGAIGGQTCVVSTYRMKNIKDEFTKTVLHELGHTLGVPHCANEPWCMMNDAKGKRSQLTRERIEFCKTCWGHAAKQLSRFR